VKERSEAAGDKKKKKEEEKRRRTRFNQIQPDSTRFNNNKTKVDVKHNKKIFFLVLESSTNTPTQSDQESTTPRQQ
jgi:hypothetical protein